MPVPAKVMTRIHILSAAALCLLMAGCSGKKPIDSTGDDGGSQTDIAPRTDFEPADPSAATPASQGDIEDGPADRLERQLNPVFFAFDKYDLSPQARDVLTGNARVLRENPGFDIIIEGHCDERGTNEYNLALGDRRARAARDFLVTSGIPASRFTVVSYGEERPFSFGHDESAWSQNRRAHFKVARR